MDVPESVLIKKMLDDNKDMTFGSQKRFLMYKNEYSQHHDRQGKTSDVHFYWYATQDRKRKAYNLKKEHNLNRKWVGETLQNFATVDPPDTGPFRAARLAKLRTRAHDRPFEAMKLVAHRKKLQKEQLASEAAQKEAAGITLSNRRSDAEELRKRDKRGYSAIGDLVREDRLQKDAFARKHKIKTKPSQYGRSLTARESSRRKTSVQVLLFVFKNRTQVSRVLLEGLLLTVPNVLAVEEVLLVPTKLQAFVRIRYDMFDQVTHQYCRPVRAIVMEYLAQAQTLGIYGNVPVAPLSSRKPFSNTSTMRHNVSRTGSSMSNITRRNRTQLIRSMRRQEKEEEGNITQESIPLHHISHVSLQDPFYEESVNDPHDTPLPPPSMSMIAPDFSIFAPIAWSTVYKSSTQQMRIEAQKLKKRPIKLLY